MAQARVGTRTFQPLPKPKTQEERFVALERVTAETVSRDVFEKEFGDLKDSLKEQRSLSLNIIYGIVIVFVFTIGAIGVELMIFHSHQNDDLHSIQSQSDSKIFELKAKEQEDRLNYQNEIGNLRRQIDELSRVKKR
jgi:hypothetical protein